MLCSLLIPSLPLSLHILIPVIPSPSYAFPLTHYLLPFDYSVSMDFFSSSVTFPLTCLFLWLPLFPFIRSSFAIYIYFTFPFTFVLLSFHVSFLLFFLFNLRLSRFLPPLPPQSSNITLQFSPLVIFLFFSSLTFFTKVFTFSFQFILYLLLPPLASFPRPSLSLILFIFTSSPSLFRTSHLLSSFHPLPFSSSSSPFYLLSSHSFLRLYIPFNFPLILSLYSMPHFSPSERLGEIKRPNY